MNKVQENAELSDSSGDEFIRQVVDPQQAKAKSTDSTWLTTRKSTPPSSSASSAPGPAKKKPSIKNAPRVASGPLTSFVRKSDAQSAPAANAQKRPIDRSPKTSPQKKLPRSSVAFGSSFVAKANVSATNPQQRKVNTTPKKSPNKTGATGSNETIVKESQTASEQDNEPSSTPPKSNGKSSLASVTKKLNFGSDESNEKSKSASQKENEPSSSSSLATVTKKLDFGSDEATQASKSKVSPKKVTHDTWMTVQTITNKTCTDEMVKAGLAELSGWSLKQAFYGSEKRTPGRLYVWFKASDWADIVQCKTIEEKLAKMIEYALYIGIDCSFARFDSHLSPLQHGSPFDRYLKLALADGEKFVCVYFGKYTERNILFESLLIGRLNHVKSELKIRPLYNVIELILGDFVDDMHSTEFTSAMISMLKDAVTDPVAVKFSNDGHNARVKSYLANMTKINTLALKSFVQETVQKMIENGGKMRLEDDVDDDLVQEAVDWGIFKLEDGNLEFNCKR